MKLTKFRKVADVDAVVRWRLDEDVHCRVMDHDGLFWWQAWTEDGKKVVVRVSGNEPTMAAAEEKARTAAVRLLSDSLEASEITLFGAVVEAMGCPDWEPQRSRQSTRSGSIA